MTTTSPEHLREGVDADRAAIVYVIRILMTRAGIKSRAALAMRVKNRISQSTVYSRMNLETDWTAPDLRALAETFGVPPAVFFAEPSLAGIAPHLGLTAAELGEELAAVQNWKMNNRPDLHVLPGGAAEVTTPRRGSLRLVE